MILQWQTEFEMSISCFGSNVSNPLCQNFMKIITIPKNPKETLVESWNVLNLLTWRLSKNRGTPVFLHFNGIFPSKPSMLGYPVLERPIWRIPLFAAKTQDCTKILTALPLTCKDSLDLDDASRLICQCGFVQQCELVQEYEPSNSLIYAAM